MNAHRGTHSVCPRPRAVDSGNSVGRDKVSALAHLLQQHSHGEHAAYRIAVWPGMRANQKSFALPNDLKNGLDGVRSAVGG
jgi:hypothetical protein